MNYAEVDLIHKNIFTSLNALKNGMPTLCSREIVEEIHILILTSSPQEILYASAATKVELSQSHSIVPCASLDIGHFVRRGGLAWEVQCLSVPVSLRFEHRQKLLLHHLPANREICSEKPSHKNKPSSQKSKQERLGEQLIKGHASAH